uniref:EGF-like domain-containing protein n=1 Tax=Panagrolaimus sp. JU765 TaxID=591449 RepID=A0AC34QV03_9BILA
MAEDTALKGPSSLPQKPADPNYVSKLEEKLKDQRKMKEQAAVKDLAIPTLNLKLSDDSTDSWRSFIGSTKNVKQQESSQNVTKSKPTITTSMVPLPPPAPTKPPVTVLSSIETPQKSAESDQGEFGQIVSGIWNKVKGMVGFSPDCKNGGTKRLGGKCFCPDYFLGDFCEIRQCLNNGTLVRIKTIPLEEMCKCPNPQYISGRHCEVLNCANGGKPLSNGSCKCIDNWYTGQFCEYYAASWFAVLGIPLICIAVIALCCVICRLDFCPKRSSPYRENRRRNRSDVRRPRLADRERHRHRYDDPQTLMIRENLLNDCQQRFTTPMQIVRLENIPVYNPRIPALPNDEFKPLEPPPSYEQAVASCPSLNPAIGGPPQPPTYSAENSPNLNPPPIPRVQR